MKKEVSKRDSLDLGGKPQEEGGTESGNFPQPRVRAREPALSSPTLLLAKPLSVTEAGPPAAPAEMFPLLLPAQCSAIIWNHDRKTFSFATNRDTKGVLHWPDVAMAAVFQRMITDIGWSQNLVAEFLGCVVDETHVPTKH